MSDEAHITVTQGPFQLSLTIDKDATGQLGPVVSNMHKVMVEAMTNLRDEQVKTKESIWALLQSQPVPTLDLTPDMQLERDYNLFEDSTG